MGAELLARAALMCFSLLFSTGLLAKVSTEGHGAEFRQGGLYALYAENRRLGLPNFITEDLLLQAYSLLRARQLQRLERERLLPALESALLALEQLIAQNPSVSSARVIQYIALVQALVSGQNRIDGEAPLQRELNQIRDASGVQHSPLWGYALDYSQFKPTGPYAHDPDLNRYFIASRYASSVLFAVVPSAATGVTQAQADVFAQQAIELSRLLLHPSVADHYTQLTDLLDWQFGPSDDLQAQDITQISAQPGQRLSDLLRAEAQMRDKVPTVVSQVLMSDKLEVGLSATQALTGWRLLPARRAPHAQAMQRLVTSDASTLRWTCKQCSQPPLSSAASGAWYKTYPSYRELMAALGSQAAETWVEQSGLSSYSDYGKRLQQVAQLQQQSTGLAAQQLQVLRAAFTADDSQQALHSGAGFWLWQRYLSQLYQKQSSTPFRKGLSLESSVREGASISVNVHLYNVLADLALNHAEQENDAVWVEFANLVQRCAQISKQVGDKYALDWQQQVFLNGLDRRLQALTGHNDLPIVSELHKNYRERQVLQLGLDYPLVSWRGEARGGRFQVREFRRPLGLSLNSSQWRELLASEGAK
ncbi:MAG: DUF3160 domain-containing protein [Granulosicoccaceae bacterium]